MVLAAVALVLVLPVWYFLVQPHPPGYLPAWGQIPFYNPVG